MHISNGVQMTSNDIVSILFSMDKRTDTRLFEIQKSLEELRICFTGIDRKVSGIYEEMVKQGEISESSQFFIKEMREITPEKECIEK
ncbi:MAG: hypothetical protein NTV72_00425 [Candidatus Taylorbacteria bacterium]|nr:hypothetical protein [Candidatus Taylorbacteria bacterium]